MHPGIGNTQAAGAFFAKMDTTVAPPTSSTELDAVAPIQRIVLLGFMCSGKSTVGASLARRLDWRYLDFDVEIERREDRPVGAIIDERGEEYFRALEAELTREIAGVQRVVLAPGGAWITRPEMLEMIRPRSLALWLRISAEETVRRLLRDDIARPLRDHPDPVVPIREILSKREPLYRLADATIPSEGRTVEDIAYEIEQLARTRGVLRTSVVG
jgi:shikimate kinase